MCPIARIKADINVVEAAKIRIRNMFRNGLKVYLSFSGGKDSLVLGHLVYDLIQKGEISASQLEVIFIDEEAMFPCIIDRVMDWRKRFMLAGCKFTWFALEVRHFNCFNMLTSDESFICWDREKEDVWVRRPPSFAVKSHPLFRPREETYQTFLTRYSMDGLSVVGLRTAESIQRLKNIASTKRTLTTDFIGYPIYDWTNQDVWRYLLENKIEIPDIYIYLYQAGVGKNGMRVSQFFSNDTAKVLVKMNEFYPDLMSRVIKREPNAYIASLYWDSEMFGRRSSKRRKMEALEERVDTIDYKQKLKDAFSDISRFSNPHHHYVAIKYKQYFMQMGLQMNNTECRGMYEALMAGDPKLRSLRALVANIRVRYVTEEAYGGGVIDDSTWKGRSKTNG